MSNTLLVILISVGAVGVLVAALALTLILKGRPMRSEIEGNEHMRSRGIECAVRQLRREEEEFRQEVRGEAAGGTEPGGCAPCAGCGVDTDCTRSLGD